MTAPWLWSMLIVSTSCKSSSFGIANVRAAPSISNDPSGPPPPPIPTAWPSPSSLTPGNETKRNRFCPRSYGSSCQYTVSYIRRIYTVIFLTRISTTNVLSHMYRQLRRRQSRQVILKCSQFLRFIYNVYPSTYPQPSFSLLRNMVKHNISLVPLAIQI
jgi:hypothetical protein